MTTPIDLAISVALCERLRTPDLGVVISWPYVPLKPVPTTAYLDVQGILRAEPQHFGIAFVGSTIRRGVFQIDVVVPDTGQGESTGITLAGLVIDRFPIGTVLTAGSRRLQLLKEPTLAAAVMDAPWLRFPVSIPYTLIQ